MKLFLSSLNITPQLAPHFLDLVGKPAHKIRAALIQNAADVETGPKKWVDAQQTALEKHTGNLEIIDLQHYTHNRRALREVMADKDLIWLGGGNTYYLRWLLRETHADEIIIELVKNGTVYGGSSAGAIVAGPTLKYFETADDPKEAPEIIFEGLGLIDDVVVPHIDNPLFSSVTGGIIERLDDDGFQTVPLKDSQALIIDTAEDQHHIYKT